MFEHISCVFGLVPSYKWLSVFMSLVCYACTSIFVGKILTSMCDYCKSIFKLAMNNQSKIMLVLIYAQTCAYISSHSLMFLLKSSTNVKSQKEIMSCKSRHIYQYLTRKKGKRLVLKCMVYKSLRLTLKLKYQKFQASISKQDVLF